MMPAHERACIRDLAKRCRELSELPVMRTRREMWYDHNDLKSVDPLLLVFPEGAWRELLPPESLVCDDEALRRMEWKLRARIYRHTRINDDAVAEKNWFVDKRISDTGWGLRPSVVIGNTFEIDPVLGYVPQVWKKDFHFVEEAMPFQQVLHEASDLQRIRAPEVVYDEATTLAAFAMERDLIGDILDVKLAGKKYMQFALIELYSDFRGLEDTLCDLMAEPEMVHEALSILEAGYSGLVRQYTQMGLFDDNNGEEYCGSGGVGYTRVLPPAAGAEPAQPGRMWAFAESQEFSVVSPAMHREFALEYESRLLAPFGLKAYGCCEALDDKLEDVLRVPGMRRVSISPWADVAKCAPIMGKKAVFSWKPNPSYVVNASAPEFLREYVRTTLSQTRDNVLEIVLKDTHTCHNRPEIFSGWTAMAREEIAKRK